MPQTHDTPTSTRRWLTASLRAVALLILASLLGACVQQPQSTFVRAAPLPVDVVIAYSSRGQNAFMGTLVGARGRDGAPLWRTEIGRRINAPAVVVGETIYAEGETLPLPSQAGQTPSDAVVAVRLRDGKLLWRTRLPAIELTLTADATTVLVAAGKAGLYALNAADGSVRWHQAAPLSPDMTLGQPRVADGVVIVVLAEQGVANGGLAAFREQDGAPLWQGVAGSLGATTDATLYGNVRFNHTAAWSLRTGRVLWEYQSVRTVNGPGEPIQVLAATANIVLIGTPRGSAALDATHGTLLWESPATFDAAYVTIASAGADPAFYGAHAGQLMAARAGDGAVLWRATVPGYEAGGLASVMLVGGALFAMLEGPACYTSVCRYNRLVALDAATGAIAWWRDLPEAGLLAQAH